MRFACTHQAPQSCPDCNGASAELDEYYDFETTQAQRREFDRTMIAWWFCTAARRAGRIDQPIPREESA